MGNKPTFQIGDYVFVHGTISAVKRYNGSRDGYRTFIQSPCSILVPAIVTGMKIVYEGSLQKYCEDDWWSFTHEKTLRCYTIRFGMTNKEQLAEPEFLSLYNNEGLYEFPYFFQHVSSHEKLLRVKQAQEQDRDSKGRFK